MPPKSQIILVLKFKSPIALDNDDLKISHNLGSIYAIDASKDFIEKNSGSIIAIIFVIGFWLGGGHHMLRDYTENRALKNPIKYLNPQNKPFLINHKSLINYILKNLSSYFYNEDKNGLKILDADLTSIPTQEKEWLVEEATKKYLSFLHSQYSNLKRIVYSKFIEWLKIPKPKNISEADWISYRITKIREDFDGYSYDKADMIVNILNTDLDFINQQEKDQIYDSLANIFYNSYLMQYNISKFDIEKPKFIKDTTWDKIKSAIELKRHIKVCSYIIKELELTLKFRVLVSLEDKPDFFKEEEWNKIINIHQMIKEANEKESKFIEKEIEFSKQESDLTQRDIESKLLIELLNRQLSIINNLFEKPKSIDAIESYNNPFSKGNFETLQKLSKSLLNLEDTKE